MRREGYDDETALEPSTRPRVVDEADEVLGAWSRLLAMSGVGITAIYFVVSATITAQLPLWGLPAVYLLISALYVWPLTREPRLARDVLRKWDMLRVDRALGSAGVWDDPRLEVAEAMADRVLRHPSVDDRAREQARLLVRRLKLLLGDLRRVEWLVQTGGEPDERFGGRSLSDLRDVLDARLAGILGRLTDLHRTVVLRDAEALEHAIDATDRLLAELEAEREVERLLSEAEGLQ